MNDHHIPTGRLETRARLRDELDERGTGTSDDIRRSVKLLNAQVEEDMAMFRHVSESDFHAGVAVGWIVVGVVIVIVIAFVLTFSLWTVAQWL